MNQQESAFTALKSLNPYLVRYRKKLLLGLFFVLLTNLFNVLGPVYVSQAIDSLKSSVTTSGLMGFGLIIISFAIGRGIFLFLVRQTIIVVSREAEYDIRNDLYTHIQFLSMSYFKTHSTGDILAKNTNDINSVRSYLGPGIMYSANTLISFIFIIPTMLYVNWKLTLIALIPLPLMSYLVFKVGKIIHQTYAGIQAQYSTLTSRVQENFSGIRIVKSFVRELSEIEQFEHLNRDYLRKNLKLGRLQAIFYSSMSLLTGLSVVLVIWFGGYLVIENQLSLGNMTQFVMYVGMLIWPMIALGWVINIIQQASASQARLNLIMNEVPEIRDESGTDHTIVKIDGKVEFRGVGFSYPDRENVLRDISFSVQPGEILAITGPTGAGKSTLVNLVMRLFDVKNGQILVDGNPIQSIPLKVLRQSIGYVPQESFLFSDTIRNNIAFGVEFPNDEAILDVSETALIRENIEDFPQKFETYVGERGITLSGGQKQRTTIARALMREPNILILDDCLSSVDTQTEDLILQGLREVMRQRTSIIISHRISTIQDADQILVLNNGEIAERGTHESLLKLNGLYTSLYQKQLLEEELKALT
ncbi:MAG: ABC transporter ATP-binding protein/permease [Bacteroidetes bacterium]|nr:ABC transporter ATP-binding protein/permease [Bacteroidota bacterium]